MAARPLSAYGNRRSVNLHSQANGEPGIARFKVCRRSSFVRDLRIPFQGENIILLELDSPTRTTRDYEGPMVSPMIQAAIENAMKEEDHLELDARYARKKQTRTTHLTVVL